MENAIKIIQEVDDFLKRCKIFQEVYIKDDGLKTIYLYIKNGKKKVYFYYTTFCITYYYESLGPLTRKDAKHIEPLLQESQESQNLLTIRATYCVVNGIGFSVILQAKILALAFLNNCLIAKKDDMTDAASSNSVQNMNHILSFWNPEHLYLLHTTDIDIEEYQKHIQEYTREPICLEEESDDSDSDDEYFPVSDTEDETDDSTEYEAEPDLKICVPDSTKYAIIPKSCAYLVTMFEWYLPEKQTKFTSIPKKELIEMIFKNKKNGVWEFMEPCAEVGILE